MPIISLRDWVGAVVHLAEHDDASGPFNLCLPEAPTNAEFTRALAAAVHRPAFLPAPAAAIQVAGGKMAPELLGSLNVRPGGPAGLGLRVPGPRRRRAAHDRAGRSGLTEATCHRPAADAPARAAGWSGGPAAARAAPAALTRTATRSVTTSTSRVGRALDQHLQPQHLGRQPGRPARRGAAHARSIADVALPGDRARRVEPRQRRRVARRPGARPAPRPTGAARRARPAAPPRPGSVGRARATGAGRLPARHDSDAAGHRDPAQRTGQHAEQHAREHPGGHAPVEPRRDAPRRAPPQARRRLASWRRRR